MNTPDDSLDPQLLRRFALQPGPGADAQFLQALQRSLDRQRRWAGVRSLAVPLIVVVLLAAATPLVVVASQTLGRWLQLGMATQWLWLCAPFLAVWPLLRLRAR